VRSVDVLSFADAAENAPVSAAVSMRAAETGTPVRADRTAAASAILPFSANQRGLSGKPNRAMI
jgi:hypothetical protein